MPAPADFVVNNISPATLTIQTQAIASGASFTVVFANIVTWAKDPFLQVYLYSGQVTLTILGVRYQGQAAISLLQQIAAGTVLFAS